MPEGPQVYRMAEKLRETLTNAILESIVLYEHPPEGSDTEDTPTNSERHGGLDSRVVRVLTKGKRAVIVFDDGQGILLTFALAGKLEYNNGPSVPEREESTVAIMTFLPDKAGSRWSGDDQLHVTLRDPQHLASATLDNAQTIVSTMLATGFDPLHTITGMREWLAVCKAHPGQLVATFITNQSIVAGVGNRYRSEIMHVARIAPDSRIRDLSSDQLQLLLISIYRVLKMASRGEYTFAVYGLRESIPDGIPVIRAEVAKGILVWTTAKSARRAPAIARK